MKSLRLRHLAASVLLAVFTFAATGCGKKSDHAGHSHGGGHEHKAPHGGSLVEVGSHQFNLEIVRDAKAGTLTAYVLDAHAENFVRIAAPALVMQAQVDGRAEMLTLTAVANSATGETVGNTSQFTASAEWLKKAEHFDAVLPALEIRGATFANVKFHLHDH